MHYEGDIIRPPSEAGSIILQATVGCSHNRCTFCGAYREKRFRIKDEAVLLEDLDYAATLFRHKKTLFLADGDALAIPRKRLKALLILIREKLPDVRRVSLYANARDILRLSADELCELNRLGVKRIYMGLESGHDKVLEMISKGASSRDMIRAGGMVREAGIFLSVTVLLGIAGRELSQEHARATAAVLNQMEPNQVAVLTLMILENTPLAEDLDAGTFQMPDRAGLFRELRTLVQYLDLSRSQFQANHASNYFALDGRLPRDKELFLATIDRALDGAVQLKNERARAL